MPRPFCASVSMSPGVALHSPKADAVRPIQSALTRCTTDTAVDREIHRVEIIVRCALLGSHGAGRSSLMCMVLGPTLAPT